MTQQQSQLEGFNFVDKAVLITGASRGLGGALAERLAAAGSRVVLVAREPKALEQVAHRIVAQGGEAHALAFDVGNKQDIYPLVGAATALVGPLDVLIHNASSLGPLPLRSLLDTECEDLIDVLNVNLIGPFRLSKAVVGAMALRQRGLVLHISSDAALVGYERWGAYGVSKAALDQLARVWASELADHGVQVLSVDPGEMNTQMHRDAVPDAKPDSLADPRRVAEKIVQYLQNVSFQTGERIIIQDWRPA